MISDLAKSKKPRCVFVYEKLYDDIKNGVYKVDSRLPSENDLALIMGVSRMTLRQALKFLQDDGIVKNIKGKGNFIVNTTSKWSDGLEKLTHPIYKCLNTTIDEVETSYSIEPSTGYTEQILKRHLEKVVFVDRWYKNNGNVIAYSFSTIPLDTINEFNINLNIDSSINEFIENTIYTRGNHSMLRIQFSTAGNISSKKYKISSCNEFYLIQEEIYCNLKFPSMHNKHYLPIDNSTIDIMSTHI
ncbi:MAG: GntR family transcriptional regulator [Clostridium sp.]